MKVRLRPITEEDTKLIVKWRNQPFVLQYFIDRRSIDEVSHLNYYRTRIETGQVKQFIILCDNNPVGSVFLRDVETIQAEFGIFIGEEEYMNKGVGRDAANLILAYAFGDLGLKRVILRVLKSNLRAIRSYEKVGFRQVSEETEKCSDGTDLEVVFMEILKEGRV